MRRPLVASIALALAFAAAPLAAQAPAAPAPAPAPYATTKVADNVYVFRAGGYQSMFVVTPEGVIATDPIGYSSKEAPAQYLAEIRKITPAPVKYVIYSHHHYDHVAGGKPFKDAGAIVVAHRNAHKRLAALQSPDVVMPDMIVEDSGSTILLGGTRIDLLWLGNNHSDNTLVMLLPRERIIFTVDWLPIQAVMFRDAISILPSRKRAVKFTYSPAVTGSRLTHRPSEISEPLPENPRLRRRFPGVKSGSRSSVRLSNFPVPT